jgi:hypothetical protein
VVNETNVEEAQATRVNSVRETTKFGMRCTIRTMYVNSTSMTKKEEKSGCHKDNTTGNIEIFVGLNQ